MHRAIYGASNWLCIDSVKLSDPHGANGFGARFGTAVFTFEFHTNIEQCPA